MTPAQSLLVIFGVVFFGALCTKRRIFNISQIEAFGMLLFKVMMPCYLFIFTLQSDVSVSINKQFACSYILTILIVAFFIAYYYRLERLSEILIKILTTCYVNSAVYSLPVITLILGEGKSAILITLIQITIIQPLFVLIISLINYKDKSLVIIAVSLLKNPLVYMPTLGLFCNILSIDPPLVLTTIIKNLGMGISGMALFIFGLNFYGLDINKKKNIDKNLILMVLIKNIISPLIAFFIGFYIYNLEEYWLYSLIIIASSPSAFIIYFIAKEFKLDQVLIKKVVIISSVTSLFTLPLMILLMQFFA